MNVLRVAPFRRLTIAWTFSNLGDSALYLTLAIWVKDLTGSSTKAGLVFLFLALPVLLAPIAGRYVDRHSRRATVVMANVVTAVGVLSLVAVGDRHDIWLIYAVTFGYGFLGYVTAAARAGLVRDLLDDSQLVSGNGVLSTIDQALKLVSPLIGAAAFARYGGAAVAVITASTLLVAGAVTATVAVVEHIDPGEVEREGSRTALTAGFRHIRGTAPLGIATLTMGIAIGVAGLANATIFAVVDGLSRPPEFFSVLAAFQGAGGVVGGVTAAWMVRRRGEILAIAIGLFVLGVALATFALPNVGVAVGAMTVVGLAIPWTIVAFLTLTQRLTPGPLQGRVSAAANMALSGPQTVGMAVGAVLVAFVDYRLLVVAMGVVIAACSVPLVPTVRSAAPATTGGVPAPATSAGGSGSVRT